MLGERRALVAAGAALPVGRAAEGHFRFGVCDNALAAADFAALLAFGLLSTLLAADAAFALVCRVFLLVISLITSARVPCGQAGTGGGQIRVNAPHLATRSVPPRLGLAGPGREFVSEPVRLAASDQVAPTSAPAGDVLPRCSSNWSDRLGTSRTRGEPDPSLEGAGLAVLSIVDSSSLTSGDRVRFTQIRICF